MIVISIMLAMIMVIVIVLVLVLSILILIVVVSSGGNDHRTLRVDGTARQSCPKYGDGQNEK
jgi:hypothetical protein